MLSLIVVTRRTHLLRTRRPGPHILRAVLNTIAFLFFFTAIARIPLADALALGMTTPIFIALFSGLILDEHPRPIEWLAAALGFVGVVIMVGPEGGISDGFGVFCALAGSFFFAMLMLATRWASDTEHSETLVFYTALGVGLITLTVMPWFWNQPDIWDLGAMLVLGGISALGHWLMVQAYRFAPAYIVAPFDYTALIWGIVIGFLFWGEIPSGLVLMGSGIVISAGLIIMFKHRRTQASFPVDDMS